MTAEEFALLPDYRRTELVRGVVDVREPVGYPHGYTALQIGVAISTHARTHALGAAFVEAGCTLRRDPDTVRGPDVSFLSTEHLAVQAGPGYTEGAPDLVVEVLSPSNRPGEVAARVAEYLEAGARLIWIADPKRRTVTVYGQESLQRTLGEHEVLDGGDVLPGFRFAIAEMFNYPFRT